MANSVSSGQGGMSLTPAWLSYPLLQQLFELARKCGGEGRIVGGAVRDIYLAASNKIPVAEAKLSVPDIDMAVSVPIIQLSDAARAAGLAVYETGLAHGTVTIAADNRHVEVTQLRTDHDSDGRHARIEPTQSWEEDAKRRDFTINALYLDADGRVHDPQGGLADIASGQLRFIGRAEERLAEDYLRLLRGLRLRAQYPGLWMDAADTSAMAAAIGGLSGLSAERIAAEFKLICAGTDALAIIAEIRALGVDRAIFGHEFMLSAEGAAHLSPLWGCLSFIEMLCLLTPIGQREPLARRLKLSRREIRQAGRLDIKRNQKAVAMLGGDNWQQAVYILSPDALFAYGEAIAAKQIALDGVRLRHIAGFQLPACPVKGGDIQKAFGLSGADIRTKLAELEARWVASDFTLTTAELLGGKGLIPKQD